MSGSALHELITSGSRSYSPLRTTFSTHAQEGCKLIFKQSPWVLKSVGRSDSVPISRKIGGSRYSSSRASVVVSAVRIMSLFIGLSLLLFFDFDGMAIGVTHQTGPLEPKLSVSESSFAGRFALGLTCPQAGSSSLCVTGSVDPVAVVSQKLETRN